MKTEQIIEVLEKYTEESLGIYHQCIRPNKFKYIARELSSIAGEKDEHQTIPVLNDLSESDKSSTIDQFVRMTAKHTLQLFLMLDLKTHIKAKVVNDATGDSYEFSFKKIQPSDAKDEQKTISDESKESIKIRKEDASNWYDEHESEYKGVLSRHHAVRMISEYHKFAQSQPQAAVIPDDEAMKDVANDYANKGEYYGCRQASFFGFIRGFNYAKSQVKVLDLRDFWEWVNKGEVDSYATRKAMVDEYLEYLTTKDNESK